MCIKTPKSLSAGEEEFALHCHVHGLKPEREARFDSERRWRVDFLWRSPYMLAVEIEGGIWSNGRHVRGAGYSKDIDKYNALSMAGYRLLRFSTAMVRSGEAIQTVLVALGATELV